jgi:hypothetical protein
MGLLVLWLVSGGATSTSSEPCSTVEAQSIVIAVDRDRTECSAMCEKAGSVWKIVNTCASMPEGAVLLRTEGGAPEKWYEQKDLLFGTSCPKAARLPRFPAAGSILLFVNGGIPIATVFDRRQNDRGRGPLCAFFVRQAQK